MEESELPNIQNGNFILSAHNGTSSVSYFDRLIELQAGDEIFVYYEGEKYKYVLDHFYDVDKNGDVEIRRDNEKTTITLITCKNSTKNKQTVYIGYLSN